MSDLPTHLTDAELMESIPALVGDERAAMARLLARLAEVEARRLYVPAGYDSLYAYCHEGLGYSEDEAYNRKTVALLARRYPAVIEMLADGRLGLTVLRLLARVVNDDNWQAVFAEAAGKAKRDVENLVARLAPQPDVPATLRKLPGARAAVPERQAEEGAVAPLPTAPMPSTAPLQSGDATGGPVTAPTMAPAPASPRSRPIVAPLSPERYRAQFTIGEGAKRKLREVQDLMRRELPDGDPGQIFEMGLDLLLIELKRRKHGLRKRDVQAKAVAGKPAAAALPPVPALAAPADATAVAAAAEAEAASARPRRRRRHMPAATRRVVSSRDAIQCAFVSADGRRCTARAYLEYHHAGVPFARGGGEEPVNIALFCKAHNLYEGRRIFGAFLPPEIRAARAQYDAMLFPVPERRMKT
jgi:hypothetical protein